MSRLISHKLKTKFLCSKRVGPRFTSIFYHNIPIQNDVFDVFDLTDVFDHMAFMLFV